jgi:hypothetical protein
MHTIHLSRKLAGTRLAVAAPVVSNIRVADPEGHEHPAQWDGLIDTGSSHTIIPLEVATTLGMERSGTKLLAGFDQPGEMRRYPEYWVRLSIPGLPDVVLLAAFAAPARKHILLGRDFINQHVLLIDGRAEAWGISRPSAFLRMALWCLGVRR